MDKQKVKEGMKFQKENGEIIYMNMSQIFRERNLHQRAQEDFYMKYGAK